MPPLPPDSNQSGEEGWKVVTANDKKRVMRKRGVRRKLAPGSSSNSNTTVNRLNTVAIIDECVKECIQYLSGSEDGVRRTTIGMLSDAGRHEVDEIVCLGIGNFSKSSPTSFDASLWQLSFILAVQSELKCSKISFYDPQALPIENEYLQRLPNSMVLETNHQGKYTPTTPALFFLPHCPRQLYENVIAENWGNGDLYIIGNSLKHIVDGCDFMHCTKRLLPFCTEFSLAVRKEEHKRAPGNLEGAFNDTFLCWIESVPWDEVERPSIDDASEDLIDGELL